MALSRYSQYKIIIAPDSKKRQGLRTGDVVRRQYTDGEITRYSLMVVLDTGTDIVAGPDGRDLNSPYFIGALLEGDEPRDGELLDFVRMTSLTDQARSGAMYLTASDADSPYMDAIDGLGSEYSLCHPHSAGEYGFTGENLVTPSYRDFEDGVSHIFRLTKNSMSNDPMDAMGFCQTIPSVPEHPARLIVSYKIRSSKPCSDVRVLFQTKDYCEQEAWQDIDTTVEWQYRLFAVTIDFPADVPREFLIDFKYADYDENDWWEIAELNIVRQSDLSNFSAAMKVRVGRITGVADPLFGVLEGYGAYFQNLYATKNVNVAGTLTAGDEQGFASTFYVGRIHKNCFVNSLEPKFTTWSIPCVGYPPAGIGKFFLLPIGTSKLECQDEKWASDHQGQQYCLSFWAYAVHRHTISIEQGGEVIGTVDVDTAWQRHHLMLKIASVADAPLRIDITASQTFFFASPQLEAGTTPTLYQPTDQTLAESSDYGAWFARGGIGGTIQNPLLRLEADGSIRSANGSFVINTDGTGYFAGGKFSWTKDTIDLKDITLRWEDFDKDTQQELRPKSVSISGSNAFHYADALIPVAQPETITLVATEQNFTAENRRWEYLASAGEWKDAGGRDTTLLLRPDSHTWEEREVLTLRYTASYQGKEYSATFTVAKLYDGESAYSVYIDTDKGTVLQNGIGEITLTAHVMRGADEVTEHIPENSFLWTRQSDDPNADMQWNFSEPRGRTLLIDGGDVARKAVFNCEILLNQ